MSKVSQNNSSATDPLPGFEMSLYVRCPGCRHPLIARMGAFNSGPGFWCECNPEPKSGRIAGGFNTRRGMRVDLADIEDDCSRGDYLSSLGTAASSGEGASLKW